MRSITISGEIKIDASPDKVWQSIAKFGDIHMTSPGVVKSFLTSKTKTGVGATRHCDFTGKGENGGNVEEKITAWDEGKSYTVEIYEFKKVPGIKQLRADFEIREERADTYLKITFIYSMKNILFDFLNLLVVKRANTKSLHGLIAGYKKHIETGVEVSKDTKLDYDKVIVLEV